MDELAFKGVRIPGTDFGAVRDQLRTRPAIYDVDLTNARSLAAGTALIIPLQGNFFYIDQRASTGIAQVRFEDVTPGGTPITIYPGSCFFVAFTQIAIENAAQAGLTLRIVYGVDVQFVPSTLAGVSVLNTVDANVTDRAARLLGIAYGNLGQLAQKLIAGVNALQATPWPALPTASYSSNAGTTGNTAIEIFSAGTNANGAIVWTGEAILTTGSTSVPRMAYLAKATPPANIADGVGISVPAGISVFTALATTCIAIDEPQYVPAGLGLYFLSSETSSADARHLRYTLL